MAKNEDTRDASLRVSKKMRDSLKAAAAVAGDHHRRTAHHHVARVEVARRRAENPNDKGIPIPEFRKELLDAMKQGAPERYRSEVQRYYEELVK